MSGSNSSVPGSAASSRPEPLSFAVHSLPDPRAVPQRRAGRWQMLLVLAMCAAPVVASYFTFYVVQPSGSAYGELIAPSVDMPTDLPLTDLQGQAVSRPVSLRGQWLLAVVQGSDCLRRGLRAPTLRATPAARDAGQGARRVDKVWLIPDTNACPLPPMLLAAVTQKGAEVIVLRVPQAIDWRPGSSLAPGKALADHFYVVDPMGNWMDARARRPRAQEAQGRPRQAAEGQRQLGHSRPMTDLLLPLGQVAAIGGVGRHWPADLVAPTLARQHADGSAARADLADAVPDLRPDRFWRLHAPDRLRPGLPRLAGLLQRGQPRRRARAHRGGADGDADRPGDARQGVDRDDPPLPRQRRRPAHPRVGRAELAAQAPARRKAGPSPWWPTLSLVWVCVVGAFGRLTVTMKLFPAIVTGHLLLAIGLLMLLAWQREAYEPQPLAVRIPHGCAAAIGRARCSRCSRWRLAAGSAPITRCWPATSSPPATAGSGGRIWTLPRVSSSGATWGNVPTALAGLRSAGRHPHGPPHRRRCCLHGHPGAGLGAAARCAATGRAGCLPPPAGSSPRACPMSCSTGHRRRAGPHCRRRLCCWHCSPPCSRA